MPRSPTSDLIAIFCMPGLEEIAEPLFPWHKPERAVAMVAFLAGRSAVGSANALTAELGDPVVWARIRAAAAEQGRLLPKRRPTYDELYKLRERIGDEMNAVLLQMQTRFIIEAFKLARSVGLCDPSTIVDNLSPVRSNTIYADGTWWKALSGVYVDKNGVVIGSRSEALRDPRIARKLNITKHGEKLYGVPMVMVGVHGDDPRQRIVLGLRRFDSPLRSDGLGEDPAAAELLREVLQHSDGGVRWLVYDMLFQGENLNELAKQGVIGVAAMRQADSDAKYSILATAAGEHSPPRFNNDPRKVRFKTGAVGTAFHRVGNQSCKHALSSIDGSLRAHPRNSRVAVSSPLCTLRQLDFEPVNNGDEYRMVGRYEIPCPHGPFPWELQLTGYVHGYSGVLMLNRIRPINEYDPKFAEVKGWRQDVESLNATMKRVTPLQGRATSLEPEHFELDVLGMALWVNARCWDERVGQVSHGAKSEAARKRNSVARGKTRIALEQEAVASADGDDGDAQTGAAVWRGA